MKRVFSQRPARSAISTVQRCLVTIRNRARGHPDERGSDGIGRTSNGLLRALRRCERRFSLRRPLRFVDHRTSRRRAPSAPQLVAWSDPGRGLAIAIRQVAIPRPQPRSSRHGRAGDAERIQMVSGACQLSSPAGSADGVLRTTEQHRCLGDVERPCSVLEHQWNTTVVHGWGSLVMGGLSSC